jgi:hypothetical protein
MVRHLALWVFCFLLAVGCQSTEKPMGSIIIPTSCGNGLFLGGTGTGSPITCQSPGVRNGANPADLPLFSPVTVTELVNANGDNLNGAGHFYGCNRGGTPCGNTHGVGFWVVENGHQALGVRFWWQGDATWETQTHVRCRLWDFRSPGTSVATGTMLVNMSQEYSCMFGTPYTMTAGRPYAVSIVDIGPCQPVGPCVLGATQMNSTGVDYACGNMYANNSPVWGSPWLEFSNVETGVTGEHYFWAGLESSGVGDFFPQGTDSACSPQEPIVQ